MTTIDTSTKAVERLAKHIKSTCGCALGSDAEQPVAETLHSLLKERDEARATLARLKGGYMMDAGVFTARGITDLGMMVISLAEQGYRIITVIDTQNGDYHVVAQKDATK